MVDRAEQDNFVRWDPSSRQGHVESFFVKANHPSLPQALWLKWTIFAPAGRPDEAVGEAWAVFFDAAQNLRVAVKQVFAAADCAWGRERFAVAVGPCQLGPGLSVGSCSSGGHDIRWDLSFRSSSGSLRLLPHKLLYDAPLPRSKLVSPYPDARFSGRLNIDGREVELDSWPGMQGHNWGREHAHHYAWGHCNLFEGEPGTVFEGVSSRLQLGPFTTPILSLFCLRWRGQNLRFNRLQDAARHTAHVEGLCWSFQAEGPVWQLSGECEAARDQTVGLFYENPDHAMTFCLNSKLACARLQLRRRSASGWETEAVLHSRAMALEIATRDSCHGVRMFV